MNGGGEFDIINSGGLVSSVDLQTKQHTLQYLVTSLYALISNLVGSTSLHSSGLDKLSIQFRHYGAFLRNRY